MYVHFLCITYHVIYMVRVHLATSTSYMYIYVLCLYNEFNIPFADFNVCRSLIILMRFRLGKTIQEDSIYKYVSYCACLNSYSYMNDCMLPQMCFILCIMQLCKYAGVLTTPSFSENSSYDITDSEFQTIDPEIQHSISV